jgi:predicted secreted hydrolase
VRRIEVVLLLSALLFDPTAEGRRTRSQTAEEEWKRVEPGLELSFPRDHGAHAEYRTEWWYVSGQLEDEAGERSGFQFTIFRRGLDAGPSSPGESPLRARQVWAGHLALCAVGRGEMRFAERLRRGGDGLARAAPDELDLVLEDWSLRRDEGGRLLLSASDPALGIGLELALRPEKPLVLHGEGGTSRKGSAPGNASAYVSWTRLAVEGSLRTAGRERAVRGSAWYDHEFGSSVLEPGTVGWDWFGLQLDDGRELMAFVLRDSHGNPTPASAATLVERDGRTRILASENLSIRSPSTWTSPRTGAVYPASWRIEIPESGIALEVLPLVADCELDSRSTAVRYWEGPVEVRGSSSGRGYAELTGYAGSMTARF